MEQTKQNRNIYILLALIVAISSWLMLRSLGSNYITLWDEAVHVNVVKNLANNCCTPTLHLRDLATDYRDWSNNYVWLHKPLLPMYVQAGFYRLFGESLWAFRLPGWLFAELIVLLLFVIGKRHFSAAAGLGAAALFAFNPYVFELVQGRQFSGFNDILFVFFLALQLLVLLEISARPKRAWFVSFGLLLGLAYFCKGGLALAPAVVLCLVVLRLGLKKNFSHLVYAGGVAATLVLLQILFAVRFFPGGYIFEQRIQLEHLYKDIEYWGRPWDYFLTFYFWQLLSPFLAGLGYLAVGFGLLKSKQNAKFYILASWVLIYLLPLSFAVSKVSNFIFAVLPAVCLLIAAMFFYWHERQKYVTVFAASAALVIFYLGWQANIFGLRVFGGREDNFWQRAAWILVYLGTLFATWIICLMLKKIRPDKFTFQTSSAAAFLLAGVLIFWGLIAGIYHRGQIQPNDAAAQRRLQQSALSLGRTLPKDSLVIVSTALLDKSHLYFEYWSGLDSLEINKYQTLKFILKFLNVGQKVYLLSDSRKGNQALIRQTDFGYVYRLR